MPCSAPSISLLIRVSDLAVPYHPSGIRLFLTLVLKVLFEDAILVLKTPVCEPVEKDPDMSEDETIENVWVDYFTERGIFDEVQLEEHPYEFSVSLKEAFDFHQNDVVIDFPFFLHFPVFLLHGCLLFLH